MNPFVIPPSSFRLSLRRHLRHDHQTSERGRKSEGRMKMEDGLPLLHSSFLLLPFPAIRRALIAADRAMLSDEMRTTSRSLPTSTFEIHPSNFAALPGQLFYSTQIPVCLWFEGKNIALDSSNDARLFDGETELSLVA